ncbi:15205_t:CDS:2 [Funneliformis mosseae]|uniref:15205_t:CDS:1 n=1 Tax=Funneliformis mosseae TaxID=27381 RepID=A0A9N9D335_FUNMO|nr:15205_t:CDS:2 [Funneliformis mosseae]
MYSVLLVGHDPKIPETDADYEKKLEEKQYRKSQDEKKWEKKHDIQKAKGVKKCVVKRELQYDKFLESPEEAEERAMKAKLHVKE